MDTEDADSFREFVRIRFDQLRALAFVTCGDWQTAEDATAATLATLYRRWDKVTTPDAYARTMVVRAAINEKRKPWRRERSYGSDLPDAALPDHAGAVNDRVRLHHALKRLPTRQRAVLVLRFLEGLSVEETADVLKCRPGTVKSQCARGLASARALLAAEDITLYDDEEGNERGLRNAGRFEVARGHAAASGAYDNG
ncbi:RNA polymerase sigma24 factor [Actinoplanes sp. OR16]|uniref:SigE family RNA polymerase sigma factor n=1 Tax=Actinoplanes sp. OR16 TaxID=946334 RepID=UPI000F719B2A|nr:SigE family RNA polymerase sigma factor [Actinoplanes sp. OR16]BBH65266.1 RNA polymerase sigma24 factor [Actinoplanes sp. OR16]